MAKSLIEMDANDWQLIWKEAKAKGMNKKKSKRNSKPLLDILKDDFSDVLSFDDEGTVIPKQPRLKSKRDEKTLAILKKMGYKVK